MKCKRVFATPGAEFLLRRRPSQLASHQELLQLLGFESKGFEQFAPVHFGKERRGEPASPWKTGQHGCRKLAQTGSG